jgi:hypothetical protein
LTPRVVTAPLHAHPAGRRDDRQPDQSGPAPTYLRHHGLEKAHNHIVAAPLIFRDPPTACAGLAQRQDRSSSLRCGRSVLTPVLTRRCLPGGRKPAKPLVDNVLTEPRPFRDDKLRSWDDYSVGAAAARLGCRPQVPKLDIANPHRLMFGVRYRSTTPPGQQVQIELVAPGGSCRSPTHFYRHLCGIRRRWH